jgi:murein DD-endopeptidase MepM/ murein hydrolase activator NlpD
MIATHNNGFRSGYAHLSKVILAQGDKFRAGDILALSGASGMVTGPHLHLTLRNAQGDLLDPAKYIYSV